MPFFSDDIFIKALLVLGIMILLIWGSCLILRQTRCLVSSRRAGKITRVLDTYYLEDNRKLVIFTCPFGQGAILISPKNDQVLLFPQNTTPNNPLEKIP